MNISSVLKKGDLSTKDFIIYSILSTVFFMSIVYYASLALNSMVLIPVASILYFIFMYLITLRRLTPTYGIELLSKKAYVIFGIFFILPVIRYVFFLSFLIDDLVEPEKSCEFLGKLTLVCGVDFRIA